MNVRYPDRTGGKLGSWTSSPASLMRMMLCSIKRRPEVPLFNA